MMTDDEYQRKVAEIARQTAIVQALRRENFRLRNWGTGLAILSGALAIGIVALLV